MPGSFNRVIVIILLTVLVVLFIGFPRSDATAEATSRSEIERRLALPPFAYVAETETDYSNIEQGQIVTKGALAYIDSLKDILADHPESGSSLQEVALSPDGTKVYVTDAYEPVLQVFDAETHQYLMAIELPGVEPKQPLTMENMMRYNVRSDEKFPYNLFFETCSSDVACTPDGQTVLVSSSTGLQIIDAETNQVIKTFSDINGTHIAISFDGSRAYIGTDNLAKLEPRSYADWFKLISTSDEFSLLMLDLKSWEILAEIKTYAIGGIAVRPDEPEVYFSESFQKRVRVVDAQTLEDLYRFDTEPSFSFGIGFLPDGSKAYTVCSADVSLPFLEQTTDFEQPKAEDFFCLVFNTKAKQEIKKIPLDAFWPSDIAVRSDGKKAYLSGGPIRHAVVIDTVNDVVIDDIDDKIVNTGGVAVRPFWWGNEYLEALGLKTYTLDSSGTAKDGRGSEDSAAGEIDADATGGLLDQATDSPLSTFLIVAVSLFSVFLIVVAVYLIKLSARKKMISIPTVKSTVQPPQSAPPQHHHSVTSSTFPSYCANCGKPLAPDSNFCPGCGKEIIEY